MAIRQTRRRFLSTLSLAGAATLVCAPRILATEPPPETTSVRVIRYPSICIAPQYVAEELLRAEGFTDVRYVNLPVRASFEETIGREGADFSLQFALVQVQQIDAGASITILAGIHVGCFELFASTAVRSLMELKGKRIGLKASPPDLLALMAAQVGLDPTKDIQLVTDPKLNPLELFVHGKIEGFLAFPPEGQELRARHIGHVIVNTLVDRPWSEYFCCLLEGNREYVRKYPVATKRVLRAILKAADLCAADPAGVARQLVDSAFIDRYDYALQTLRELPYDRWREYDPEDTMRWYALRLREAGLIKASPQKIIADHADWRFLDELKRELKA